MTTEVIAVAGMMCEGCKEMVQSTLSDLAGVSGVQVDLAGGRVTVDYDADVIAAGRIRTAIEGAGFAVER